MMNRGSTNKKQRDITSTQEAKAESKEAAGDAKSTSSTSSSGSRKVERPSSLSEELHAEGPAKKAGDNADDSDEEYKYIDCSQLPPPPATATSKKPQDEVPVKYRRLPAKLREMLSTPEYERIISWLPHGRAWKIHDSQAFIEHIIPHFFDYQNFNSFIRLVNAWGFRRMMKGPDRNSYYHELFLRGKPHLHEMMRRLGAKEKKVTGEEPNFASYPPCPPLQMPAPAPASSSSTATIGNPRVGPSAVQGALPVSHFLARSRRAAEGLSGAMINRPEGGLPSLWDSHTTQQSSLASLPPTAAALLTPEERLLLLTGQNPSIYGLPGMTLSRLQENNLSILAATSIPAALSRLLPQQPLSDASTLLALHRAQQAQAELYLATQQREQLLFDRAVEGLLSRELAVDRRLQLQQQHRVAMAPEAGQGRGGEDERVDAAAARRGRNWLPPLGPPASSEATQSVAFPGGTPSSGTAADHVWMTRNAETFASLMGKGPGKKSDKKPPARKKK